MRSPRLTRSACSLIALVAAGGLTGCATTAPPVARVAPFELHAPHELPAEAGAHASAAHAEVELASGSAWRGPRAAPAEADAWDVTVTPYIWLIGVDGTLKARGQEADVNMSISDVLDNLDFAGMLHVEAWKGDWGFAIDPFYGSLKAEEDIGPNELEVRQDLLIIDAIALRNLYRSDDGNTRVDGLGGIRYWKVKLDVDIDGLGVNQSQSKDWVDGLIGARVITALSDAWDFSLRADVGGFGIGSSADMEWSALAAFLYEAGPQNHFILGYRTINLDKSRGSGADEFEADIRIDGPAIGWQFAF